MEAVSYEVAGATVPFVRPGRVAGVEFVHSPRKATVGDLDQEVEVVPHQAIRPYNPAVLDGDFRESAEPIHPVDVVAEHHLAVVSTRSDVVDAVRHLDAQLASDDTTVPSGKSGAAPATSLVTCAAQSRPR